MQSRKSVASVLIFIGSLLSFSLPFVTISCGESVTFTGKDLLRGTVIGHKRVAGDPLAAVAATAALVGLGLSIVGKNMAKGNIGVGFAGAVSLLLMKAHIEGQVREHFGGMVKVTTETGFLLATLLLAFGAVWNGILVLNQDDY